jgi:hypothetical protein
LADSVNDDAAFLTSIPSSPPVITYHVEAPEPTIERLADRAAGAEKRRR